MTIARPPLPPSNDTPTIEAPAGKLLTAAVGSWIGRAINGFAFGLGFAAAAILLGWR